jgi:phage gp46-like protein
MTDLALRLSDSARADLEVVAGDLVLDPTPIPTALVSLFTDRRAELDDEIPSGTSRRGWWGDFGARWGSRLWLLERAKATPQAAADAETFAREGLEWLVTEGIAERVEVSAVLQGDRIDLTVRIHRGAAAEWAGLWAQIDTAPELTTDRLRVRILTR